MAIAEAQARPAQPLAMRPADPASALSAEQVQLIKDTVAKNATDTELRLFLQVAAATGLNPFLKEIWFIKYQLSDGRWVGPIIMTGRDGYLSLANRNPDFEGIQSFAVYSNDEFSYDSETGRVLHRFTAKRGELVGAWARVKRRGRDPVVTFALLSEYRQERGGKTDDPWKKYPSAMICKCAEAMGLKRQFAITGLVTEEEMGVRLADVPTTPRALPRSNDRPAAAQPPRQQDQDDAPLPAKKVAGLKAAIRRAAEVQGFTGQDAADAAERWTSASLTRLGKERLDQLTVGEARSLHAAANSPGAEFAPAEPPSDAEYRDQDGDPADDADAAFDAI